MGNNLHDFIQAKVAKLIFPTKHHDWYKRYAGKDNEERFKDFLRVNQKNQLKAGEKAYYYEDFSKLESISRNFIKAIDSKGNKVKLDTISLIPNNTKSKPGAGQHIINFFGVSEYYECNFRDMVRQADIS
ncbi:hypothetical protein NOVO_06640 [Rickettsiales bacterium Ac37b]|nr:hypothetical protein NOVO_06640 [Rickettsiales bacterium Ac37b]